MYSLEKLIKKLVLLKKHKKFSRMRDLYEKNTSEHHTILLRIDVEKNLSHHEKLAKTLNDNDIHATFYFHTRYNTYNVDTLKKIEELGHEIGFHHECLDRCQGDFDKAKDLFTKEVLKFREDGFDLKTICSHGELGLKKIGYKTNHDLFKQYPSLINELSLYGEVYTDIMGKWRQNYISDTFSEINKFCNKIDNIIHNKQYTQILIHPHRWHVNPLRSFFEASLDIRQAIVNKLFGVRRYKTIWD